MQNSVIATMNNSWSDKNICPLSLMPSYALRRGSLSWEHRVAWQREGLNWTNTGHHSSMAKWGWECTRHDKNQALHKPKPSSTLMKLWGQIQWEQLKDDQNWSEYRIVGRTNNQRKSLNSLGYSHFCFAQALHYQVASKSRPGLLLTWTMNVVSWLFMFKDTASFSD